ncbi:hypothetical protein AVEN_61410-1 [Araneus ventricosus]|uniref:Secreted protein n=1 Tax=Araneus ventricosus TaxID=182803 RepID=A0A4Y2QGE0_ARAVE|nr:hypothetical protein AVEN_61410-1 [Araneus ventricosus]
MVVASPDRFLCVIFLNLSYLYVQVDAAAAPSCTGWWWRYYTLGDVLMGSSGTRSCGRTDHESCELPEHHCGSVAPLNGACLPNWK